VCVCHAQAEEKRIVIKDRVQQFGYATLERLRCINNEVNSKILEHLCTYIEAQYEYFREGYEEFAKALSSIASFKTFVAQVESCSSLLSAVPPAAAAYGGDANVEAACRPSLKTASVVCATMPNSKSLVSRRTSKRFSQRRWYGPHCRCRLIDLDCASMQSNDTGRYISLSLRAKPIDWLQSLTR
jgi:hypothetical protein